MALKSYREWKKEKLEAAAFHEGGHYVAMQIEAPEWFLSAKIEKADHGWDGDVTLDETQQPSDQSVIRYIAGIGCVAEAKYASGQDLIDQQLQKLAFRIIQQVNQGVKSFWIQDPDDPDTTVTLPKATCSLADYDFVDRPLKLEEIRDSLTQARDFVKDPKGWAMVSDAARTFATPPHTIP